MNNKKSVSSRDVAREAGVSQATVSYILNGVKNVKIRPETREAVMAAVKRLNYHPDEIARGMKLKRSMSIGVITDRNVTNFFFMKTLEGIRDGVQKDNYSITLLFNKQDDSDEAEYIRYYNCNRLDGMIFAFASLDNEMAEYLTLKGIPFVKADSIHSKSDIYEVCTDHLSRIADVVEYFKSRGVERIGYAGPNPKRVSDSRLDAFKEAMVLKGMAPSEELISTCNFNEDEIFEAVKRLLSVKNRPGALLAGSPRFGLVSLKCALSMNIAVPGELKIIALGTSNFYSLVYPSLSAVEPPLYDIGRRAAEMLIDRINGKDIPKTVVLPSELVIRESG